MKLSLGPSYVTSYKAFPLSETPNGTVGKEIPAHARNNFQRLNEVICGNSKPPAHQGALDMRKKAQHQRIPPLSQRLNFPLSVFHLDNFLNLDPRILLYKIGELQYSAENLKCHAIHRKKTTPTFYSLLWTYRSQTYFCRIVTPNYSLI